MTVRQMATISVLVALAIIVSFIAIPIMPNASFLKIDFSDSILFMVAMLYGLKGLSLSIMMKGFIMYVLNPDIIGIISNMTASFVFVSLFYIIYQKTKRTLIASIVSTIAFSIVLSLLNYFIFLPLYTTLFQIYLGPLDVLILVAILPFNLIKGVLLSLMNHFLIKQLAKIKM